MMCSGQLWKQHTYNFSLLKYLLMFLLPCLIAKPTERQGSLHSSLDNLMECLVTGAAFSVLVKPHCSLSEASLKRPFCCLWPGCLYSAAWVQVFSVAVVWNINICSEIPGLREAAACCSCQAGILPAAQPAWDNVSVICTQVYSSSAEMKLAADPCVSLISCEYTRSNLV